MPGYGRGSSRAGARTRAGARKRNPRGSRSQTSRVGRGRSRGRKSGPMSRSMRRQRGGRGRKRFQAGGHGHEIGHQHHFEYHQHYTGSGGTTGYPTNITPSAGMYTTGSYSSGQAGRHYHNTGISPAGRGRMRRGGRVRRQMGGGTDITLQGPTPWNNQ